MKLNEAYDILRIHQKWRKGDQYLKQIPPSILSEAIDMILKAHYSAEMTIAIPKRSDSERNR